MIKIYYCKDFNDEFLDALADGTLEDDLRASFKYEEEAVKYILDLNSGALLSIVILVDDCGFVVFRPFEYVFDYLKENKEKLF